MPLPNTRVIHPRFLQHHAASVAGGMTARVRLRRPDTVEVRDVETGRTGFESVAAYYDGPARVQAGGGGPPQ
ncbi:MAG TPA: hypothetical protein VF657_22690, partial [Actinoplanes sp.]